MNHKFLSRIVSMALSGVLTISAMTGAVLAAESDDPRGETVSNYESEVCFSDVTPDKWFYDDVVRLEKFGIIDGFPDGKFHPDEAVSNAEFIKILLEASGFNTDTPVGEKIFPDNWASEYLSLAYAMGFITEEDINSGFLPDTPITRAAMTRMTAMALGIEPAPVEDPFSDGSDDYAKAVFGEYILRGVPDGEGGRLYNGQMTTIRSEAASIAMRIVRYRANRYDFFREQVFANAEANSLDTEAELIDLFYVLNRELMTEYTFKSAVPIEVWTEYYRVANLLYLENFYSSELQCSYVPGTNTYKLMLKYEYDFETLKILHSVASDLADEVIAEVLNDNMTAEMRVKAIHDYLILECEYDYENYTNETIPFEARVAFGALYSGKAVCQGYTAAFNMLCRLAGIRSAAVTGISPTSQDVHVWNMILLDGELLYLDVTHDDPVPDKKGQISYKYYLRTEDEMTMLGYLWDKSQTQLKYLY